MVNYSVLEQTQSSMRIQLFYYIEVKKTASFFRIHSFTEVTMQMIFISFIIIEWGKRLHVVEDANRCDRAGRSPVARATCRELSRRGGPLPADILLFLC